MKKTVDKSCVTWCLSPLPFRWWCVPPAPSWKRVLLPHILRVRRGTFPPLLWVCVNFFSLILGGGDCTHLAFDVGAFTLHLLIGAAPDADK